MARLEHDPVTSMMRYASGEYLSSASNNELSVGNKSFCPCYSCGVNLQAEE